MRSFRHYDHSQTETHPVMLDPAQELPFQSENCKTEQTVQDQIDEFHYLSSLSQDKGPINIEGEILYSPRNVGQSVYNKSNNYFMNKLESLLKFISHPMKNSEIDQLLKSFGNLQREEIELAVRRKNLLVLADKIRNKETEFLNRIDGLGLGKLQKDLDEGKFEGFRESQPEIVRHTPKKVKKMRKTGFTGARNRQSPPRESAMKKSAHHPPTYLGFSSKPKWNGSRKAGRESGPDQSQNFDDTRSNISDRQQPVFKKRKPSPRNLGGSARKNLLTMSKSETRLDARSRSANRFASPHAPLFLAVNGESYFDWKKTKNPQEHSNLVALNDSNFLDPNPKKSPSQNRLPKPKKSAPKKFAPVNRAQRRAKNSNTSSFNQSGFLGVADDLGPRANSSSRRIRMMVNEGKQNGYTSSISYADGDGKVFLGLKFLGGGKKEKLAKHLKKGYGIKNVF